MNKSRQILVRSTWQNEGEKGVVGSKFWDFVMFTLKLNEVGIHVGISKQQQEREIAVLLM